MNHSQQQRNEQEHPQRRFEMETPRFQRRRRDSESQGWFNHDQDMICPSPPIDNSTGTKRMIVCAVFCFRCSLHPSTRRFQSDWKKDPFKRFENNLSHSFHWKHKGVRWKKERQFLEHWVDDEDPVDRGDISFAVLLWSEEVDTFEAKEHPLSTAKWCSHSENTTRRSETSVSIKCYWFIFWTEWT